MLLAQWTDTSRRTLVRQFSPFFVRPLTPLEVWIALPLRCLKSSNPWMYGADGKWLHHDGVFLAHRDVTNRENLWWSYALNESYASWNRDLNVLQTPHNRCAFSHGRCERLETGAHPGSHRRIWRYPASAVFSSCGSTGNDLTSQREPVSCNAKTAGYCPCTAQN